MTKVRFESALAELEVLRLDKTVAHNSQRIAGSKGLDEPVGIGNDGKDC